MLLPTTLDISLIYTDIIVHVYIFKLQILHTWLQICVPMFTVYKKEHSVF